MWKGLVAKEKRELSAMEAVRAEQAERLRRARELGLTVEELGGRLSTRQHNPQRAPAASNLAKKHFGPAGTLVDDTPPWGRGVQESPAQSTRSTGSILPPGSGGLDEPLDDREELVTYKLAPRHRGKGRGVRDYSATFTAKDLLAKPKPAKKAPYWKRAAPKTVQSRLAKSQSGPLPRVGVRATATQPGQGGAAAAAAAAKLSQRELKKVRLAKHVTRAARQRYRAELQAERLEAKLLSLRAHARASGSGVATRKTVFDTILMEHGDDA